MRPPLSRFEVRLLLGLVLLLLALTTLAVIRRRFSDPPISVLFNSEARPHYRMDVNSASAEELALLPGIGPVKAGQIVDYRDAHGPFSSLDELSKVPGLNSKLVEEIKLGATVGEGPPVAPVEGGH